MSVRPSAWNNSAPTGWIFIKFDIWVFLENVSWEFKFITGTSDEDQNTFWIVSRSVLLKMRNVLERSCTENQNTHFVLNNFFSFQNHAVCEIMWKSTVELGRPCVYCRLDTSGYRHTLRICNTYCFFTATVILQKTPLCFVVHIVSLLNVTAGGTSSNQEASKGLPTPCYEFLWNVSLLQHPWSKNRMCCLQGSENVLWSAAATDDPRVSVQRCEWSACTNQNSTAHYHQWDQTQSPDRRHTEWCAQIPLWGISENWHLYPNTGCTPELTQLLHILSVVKSLAILQVAIVLVFQLCQPLNVFQQWMYKVSTFKIYNPS